MKPKTNYKKTETRENRNKCRNTKTTNALKKLKKKKYLQTKEETVSNQIFGIQHTQF